MRYLLDTSVLSEPVRPKPDAGVKRWFAEHEDASLYVSVLTLGEIHKGIVRLADQARRDALQNWLDSELTRRFHGRLLTVDADVAAEWGRMAGRAASQGSALPVIDGLLAATAAVHHLTVVTRNVRDFERCGVAVYNPWS